jgi:hypothetical protein
LLTGDPSRVCHCSNLALMFWQHTLKKQVFFMQDLQCD